MTDDRRATAAPPGVGPAFGERDGLNLHDLCPFLLAADGAWRSAASSREHRCTAVNPPAILAPEKQRRLCLTADHPTCATYVAAVDVRSAVHPETHDRRPVPRTTPVILDSGRLALAIPAVSVTPGVGQGALIGLLGLAFGAVLIARVATGDGSGGNGVPGAIATATPAATDGAAATRAPGKPTAKPTARPSVSIGPAAGASPTLVPTGPTAAPTTKPERPATYKIKRGDTLSGIAATYGTTVKALAALNGITDPSRIRVGQVLKLPQAS